MPAGCSNFYGTYSGFRLQNRTLSVLEPSYGKTPEIESGSRGTVESGHGDPGRVMPVAQVFATSSLLRPSISSERRGNL